MITIRERTFFSGFLKGACLLGSSFIIYNILFFNINLPMPDNHTCLAPMMHDLGVREEKRCHGKGQIAWLVKGMNQGVLP
jgi:hypothetical protein